MADTFDAQAGSILVADMIKAIQDHYLELSELDGAIGDGDHGINMRKGFTQCAKELETSPGDLSHSMHVLGTILLKNIGGAMGPLYGSLFRQAAKALEGTPEIDTVAFGLMLAAMQAGVGRVSQAKVGDKTMIDALAPAVAAYNDSVEGGRSFVEALEAMETAAVSGRDSTREMVAKVGRSSRLGERSRGKIDAGAASCALLLSSMARSARELLAG